MCMTFAQFKRMKPKYKFRLILVCVIALGIFIGLLKLLSVGIGVVRVQMNTTKLPAATAQNILEKPNMNKILELMKQNEAGNVLVSDCTLTTNDLGQVTSLTMHLLNLADKTTSEEWTLTADEKQAKLRRDRVLYENLGTRKLSMMDFKTYYPGLSRVSAQPLVEYLRANYPVGATGVYTFTDSFKDNVNPDFNSYLERGVPGIWVPKTGQVSAIQEGYQRILKCAPTVMSIQTLETKKQLIGTRQVLSDPEETLVVLFEAATY